MNYGIKGRQALVTGASRGIGRAIALELAREGVRVAVSSRTKTELQHLLKDMGGKLQGHVAIPMDLTRQGAPSRLVKALHKSFGPLDIVVHNLGGTLDVTNPFCSLEDWSRVWRINIEVAIELNQLLIPYMQKQRWGRVVHIGSTASMENNGPVTYCTAKAALAAYSRCMGRILAADDVVMTCVIVGLVFTKGGYWDQAMKKRPRHVKKYLNERAPLKRFGNPEDIAGMVTFLCSERAKFCHGSIVPFVPVEGAQSRHYFGQV